MDRHVDPFGTIILPGMLLLAPILFGTPSFVFGWAKPVPVDFRRLRRPRMDGLLVAVAGPAKARRGIIARLIAVVNINRNCGTGCGFIGESPEPGASTTTVAPTLTRL